MTGMLKNIKDRDDGTLARDTKRTESQTAQAVSKLRLELDELENCLGDLRQRLAPVLVTVPETPSDPRPKEVRELLADLPQSIFCAAGQASRMTMAMSAMMANMQL